VGVAGGACGADGAEGLSWTAAGAVVAVTGAAVATTGAVAAAGVSFDFTAAGLPLLAELLPEAPFAPSAFNATDSSTEDAAALASTPAAFSFSSNSLLERPCSFAISCTRFLLIE
jgi:hypothetical protein